MSALILDAVRTPRGKGNEGGALSSVAPVELLAGLYRALRDRLGLEPEQVDEVILGCVTQVGDQGANLARISTLYAGWGDGVTGLTINRFCPSGLDAIGLGAALIAAGSADLVVAGGVESMSRVPILGDRGAWFADPVVRERTRFVHMSVSADLIATQHGLARAELDALAAASHQRAWRARAEGRLARSVVPVTDAAGRVLLDRDESVRDGMTTERLARLDPVVPKLADADSLARATARLGRPLQNLHTVGTSPALADGASLVVLASEERARALGLSPRGRVAGYGSVGVDPVLMLTGNAPATRRALSRAGRGVGEVDLFEINESFAAVPIACARELGVNLDRVNVNGGAIALGHPLGATGGVLVATLLDELEARGQRRGVASICGGAGVASALVIER